ncbi:MAG TPA: cyclopropane fatty acyl phospholipid synthase [Calditrichaeota bacterium]|nr:cyclopropane fatty acyl phospholipid synthase [Calditrichota bacterium]
MSVNRNKEAIKELLSPLGITLNGGQPWDIQVHNERFYKRVMSDGALGLGESYMDGWWESPALDQFLTRILRSNLPGRFRHNFKYLLLALRARLFNLQKVKRAFQVGKEHYDIGNDLYERMLDKRLLYTCAYWKRAQSLDEAQEAKLELVCRKIGLQPGMTVLDLGCGWGDFAIYAAEKYGVRVTGVTVSEQQVQLARERARGLPVEIHLQDYRLVNGQYDRVISIGIMEHVGYKNYHTYMKVVDRCLKPEGIAFIHTIGGNDSEKSSNPWTNKYIFPNGMIPSIAQLGKAMENIFVMEDWHNFGPDYDKTLMAWHENFEKAWPELKDKYGERFYRMWRYYLLSSAAGFRARYTQLWQIVMTKRGRSQPDCRII